MENSFRQIGPGVGRLVRQFGDITATDAYYRTGARARSKIG
jgi:hypothetical protein